MIFMFFDSKKFSPKNTINQQNNSKKIKVFFLEFILTIAFAIFFIIF